MQPGQVALDSGGADIQAIVSNIQAQRRQIAFDAACLVQHRGIDRATRRPGHVIGAHPVQKPLGIGAGHANLAEGRQVEHGGSFGRGAHLAADLLEPVGSTEGQHGFLRLAEVQRPLVAVELTETGAGLIPFALQGRRDQFARGAVLPPGEGDFVMFTKRFGYPRGEVFDIIPATGVTLRIGLVHVIGQLTLDNIVRKRHTGATTGGDTHRVHAATEEKATRLGTFSKQERPVRSKTLGAVQQHLDFSRLEHRQPVHRVHQHRFEVIPVLVEQAEGKILAQRGRVDGLAHGLETANQQAAGIVADVEMRIMVRQGRHVAANAVHRLG